MAKDDLGIEVDDDVAGVLKDPKGGLLVKTLAYLDTRKKRQAEIEAEEAAKKKIKEDSEKKLFGIF